jgi:hypothetical protein
MLELFAIRMRENFKCSSRGVLSIVGQIKKLLTTQKEGMYRGHFQTIRQRQSTMVS